MANRKNEDGLNCHKFSTSASVPQADPIHEADLGEEEDILVEIVLENVKLQQGAKDQGEVFADCWGSDFKQYVAKDDGVNL